MHTRSGHAGRAAALVAIAGLLVPALALAWKQEASFETHVHGHEFSKVTLETNQCDLKVRLLFDAPEAAYKNASRNFYRFHARIKLDDRNIETRVFYNNAPGLRAYTYTLDTKPEACWAKTEHKLQGIDIEGCRGEACKPEAFK